MSDMGPQGQMDQTTPGGGECADQQTSGGQKSAPQGGPAMPGPTMTAMGGYPGPQPGWWAPPQGYYPGYYPGQMGQPFMPAMAGYAPIMGQMAMGQPMAAPPPPAEGGHGRPASRGGCDDSCSCHEQAGAVEQNQFGKMFGLVGDIVSGNANASTVGGLLGSCSDQFWKGALVGAGLAFLLTNPTVREGLSGLFGGVFGAKAAAGQAGQPTLEEE